MINLYAVLGVDSNATDEEIQVAINSIKLDDTDPDIAHEVRNVLLNQDKRHLYDLVHQQYQAISLVYQKNGTTTQDNSEGSPGVAVDNNHWARRLVEFY